MFDLSVTTNLAVFAVMCALSLALIFFAVDIFASKKPSVAIKATSAVFGAIAIVVGLAAAFAALGLKIGFATLSGSDMLIWNLKVPQVAGVAALATYPVTWGLAAVLIALALLDIIGAATRKGKKAERSPVASVEGTETAASVSADAETSEDHADESSENELVEAAFSEASVNRKRYDLEDVRGIMDEISGLVDNMDAGEAAADENAVVDESIEENAESDYGGDELDFGYEPAGESAKDYFSALATDETDDEEPVSEAAADESSDESEAEKDAGKPEAFGSADRSAVEDRSEEKEKEKVLEESAAAIVPERVGKTLRPSRPREVENYTTFAFKSGDARKKVVSLARNENVKEVEPQVGGLPMTKRHVIINRRNVVNMFSEYLKTKSADEKERIESSINTIIIK
ncbi:MAG: hypothetical protein HFK09_04600 [Clostridia bacterium]|nr:hypothetical protein [Clostridia bacterium]